MYLNTARTFDNVAVRDDAVSGDEKSAAARDRIAFAVKCFDRNRRRFDAADQFRQVFPAAFVSAADKMPSMIKSRKMERETAIKAEAFRNYKSFRRGKQTYFPRCVPRLTAAIKSVTI